MGKWSLESFQDHRPGVHELSHPTQLLKGPRPLSACNVQVTHHSEGCYYQPTGGAMCTSQKIQHTKM